MPNTQRLWAPWRSQYLSRGGTRRCIFCAAKRPGADRRHHVIARGRRVFALLNRYPYNNGHLMIAPYRHTGDVTTMTQAEWEEMFELLRPLMRRLRQTLHPQGFNIGCNLGRIGGAGIPGHLHLHVVPRWNGDTNFMPTIAKTKVISQSLGELYTLLTSAPRRRR